MNTSGTESVESRILKALLESGGSHLAGSRLAESLGVSRVTIWTHMENLRSDGFSIEAIRNKGYRLLQVPEGLSEPYLHCLLPELAVGNRLHFHRQTGSTNRDAERLLAEGKDAPFVVMARRQTAGRGRLGRRWQSDDESNLYASFAFRPLATPERMRDFTLWIGASVCRCLEEESGLKPGLKWPNDVWYGDRKMGGILTEAKVNADQILELVLGIGLNINSTPAIWPTPLCHEAVSLREALGRSVDINRLTATLVKSILRSYEAFLAGNHREEFRTLWERYDLLNGREVTAYQGTQKVTGKAAGIDEYGRLKVIASSGETAHLSAGDVTLRSNSGLNSRREKPPEP